mmetsp:Transcript_27973/g.61382  ORF Transcript_27973/g.61382 Transcript_27973/m.61382 type:complete len:457 (+) Transcript_27973:523-1893(+)
MAANYTIDFRGAKTIKVRSSNGERRHFTVMLAVTADGGKLPPTIILKLKRFPKVLSLKAGRTLESGDRFDGVVIMIQDKGWFDEQVMKKWVNKVWYRRPGHIMAQRRSLLLLDSFSAHACAQQLLQEKCNTAVQLIPDGTTSKLQPLDVGVNRSFKTKLRQQFTSWMIGELKKAMEQARARGESTTVTTKLPQPDVVTIISWVKSAWDAVPSSMVRSAFVKAGIILVSETQQQQEQGEGSAEDQVENQESALPTFDLLGQQYEVEGIDEVWAEEEQGMDEEFAEQEQHVYAAYMAGSADPGMVGPDIFADDGTAPAHGGTAQPAAPQHTSVYDTMTEAELAALSDHDRQQLAWDSLLYKLELYCPQEDIVKKAQRLIRFSFDNIIPSFQSLALDMGWDDQWVETIADLETANYTPFEAIHAIPWEDIMPSQAAPTRVTPTTANSLGWIRHSHCTCR